MNYLTLTNAVLSRLNEVNLTQDTFASSRGVHLVAKNSVADAVREVINYNVQWPWNSKQQTETIVKGQTFYNWPTDYQNADWESFTLKVSDNEYHKVRKIDREQWSEYEKELDLQQGTQGRNRPYYVFESSGLGFGITPSPNNSTSTLTYTYYARTSDLVNWNDETNIPEQFKQVVVDGAMVHMKIFKEDMEGAQMYDAKYQRGLSNMRNIFSNRPERLYSGMLTRKPSSNNFFYRGY